MAKDDKFYLFGTEKGTKGPEFNVFEKVGLGLGSGVLKIPEAILELGAGFSDFAFNTELVSALEENFPRINVTDGVGKFVEIAVQYGVPYTAALKIGGKLNSMKKLRELGDSNKLGFSKVAGKMGYYGLPAIATETAFGSARDATLGETFGLYKGYEEAREGKVGRELGAEVLKQKFLTGIEGGALAGLITTALPPALSATASGVATGAGYVGRAVSPVLNPVAELIGNSTVGAGARKSLAAIKFAKEKIDPLSLRQLKFIKSDELTFLQRVKKKIGDLITPEGAMTREGFDRYALTENTIKSLRGSLNTFLPRAYKEVENLVKLTKATDLTGSTLTRQQAVLKDISKALDNTTSKKEAMRQLKEKYAGTDFRRGIFSPAEAKPFIDSIENLRILADDLTEATEDVFSRPALGTKTKEAKEEIGDAIRSLLDRNVESYYRAFDRAQPFRFSGKLFQENKKNAIEEAYQILKKDRPKAADLDLRNTAKGQIEQLVRLAEQKGSDGAFFYAIKDRQFRDPERAFTSLSKNMMKARDFGEGNYALSLRNLLGYEQNALRAFENKYMAIASQLGEKRYFKDLAQFNRQLGPAVAGRAEKFMFTPTRTKQQLLDDKKNPVNVADIQGRLRDDVAEQISKEYNIPKEMVDVVQVNPAGFQRGKAEDYFGIYDEINPQSDVVKDFGGYFAAGGINETLAGVKNYTNFLLASPLYKSFLMGKAGTQIGKTILSPVTQIRNFTSAAFFALHNGHFGNPFGLAKGNFSVADVLKQHGDEILPEGVVRQQDLQELARKAARKNELGVTTGSVVQREIDDLIIDITKRGGSYDTTDELFDKIYRSKAFRQIADPTKKIFNKAQQFYSKGDDFWKDFGYRFTESQLNLALPKATVGSAYTSDEQVARFIEKAYHQVFKRRPTIQKIDGKFKSREELIEEFSAEYIKNTYPNYQFVPKAVQELRRLPFGNFISFPAEILRTTGNLAKITTRELAMDTGDAAVDAYFRQMGSRRLMGQLAGYSTGPILATYSMKMLGMSDEQYEALRESQVAEWNKYSDLIMIGKEKTKDGNVKYRYLNFAYQNPYDYIRAPIYGMVGEMAAGKKAGLDFDDRFLDGFVRSFGSLLSPFLDEAILTERLLDAYRGTKKGGGRVWEETDDLGDKLASGFAHIIKGVSPGVMTQGANVASAIAQDVTPYG